MKSAHVNRLEINVPTTRPADDSPAAEPQACAFTASSREPNVPPVPCSVVVLTLNEHLNITECLQSLHQFAEVHVLDSGSTDATAEIARQLGRKVTVHRFESFAAQRNWAHDQLTLAHEWVLHLDADERMTPDLVAEIRDVIAADAGAMGGYYLAERTMLHGQWLRHASQYPRYQARLVHRQRMRFVDHGHGQREQSQFPFGRLSQPYRHLAFSHGIEHWLHKHVGYAVREAQLVRTSNATWRDLFAEALGSSGIGRRRALKSLSQRVPLRPQLRWFYVLVVCRGVLDGKAGLQYARMMKTFQEMIDLCLHERAANR